MPIQSRQTVVTVKSQSSAGSAASITIGVDESLRVLGAPTIEPIGEQLIERGDMSSSAGGVVGPVLGSQGWRVSFQTEDYGFTDLTDATSSPLTPLWAASGDIDTLTTPDRVRWTPKCGQVFATDLVYVTVQIDEIGGNQYVLYDGVASVTSEADAGGESFTRGRSKASGRPPPQPRSAMGTRHTAPNRPQACSSLLSRSQAD